jgi:3-oxoacyl-[acyl-carrier protein] reductase
LLKTTITTREIDAFAAFSGDCNPLHLNDEFARRSSFQRRVAHGMIAASYVSTVIGMQLPGPGALWMEQNFRWPAPIFAGDTIEVSLTVTHVSAGTRIVSLKMEAKNQNGKVVMEGEGKVMLLEERRQEEAAGLADRLVFISGGSGGIGSAIARTFAAAGAHVAVAYYRNRDRAESLCSEIAAEGGSAAAVHTDVTQRDAVDTAARTAADRFSKPIAFLIHATASANPDRSFLESNWEDVQRQLDIHLRGAFHCCQTVLPGMLERKTGAIVHIGAAAHSGPAMNWPAFLAAKAALKSFTKSLAAEFGPRGIRINMISPGLTETDAIATIPERVRKLQAMQAPLRRLGQPEDIARTALFLCSPAASYITGADIPVCGGSVM